MPRIIVVSESGTQRGDTITEKEAAERLPPL